MSSYKFLLKFIVIGDTGVGKSCLVLRFTENKMRDDHEVTIGIQFGSKYVKVKDEIVKLQLWDTAGQENFKSITRSYYKSAAGALLCYDITDKRSFQNVESWLTDLRNNSPESIFGNKNDMEERRQVTYDQGKELAERHEILFIETSARTGENCEKIFMNLTNQIYDKIEQGQIKVQDNMGIKIGSDYYNSRSQGIKKVKEGEDDNKQQENKKRGGCC